MDKTAFYKLSYGLYVVSSRKDDHYNGQICNTAFQVTSEPPTLAVSINKQNLTHEYILASGKFNVSIISKSTPMPFIGHFGFKCGRDINKFGDEELVTPPGFLGRAKSGIKFKVPEVLAVASGILSSRIRVLTGQAFVL
jgi:flavin reductase (DIM6/NTAB) family NADH-FMN oxidoreductase RutF